MKKVLSWVLLVMMLVGMMGIGGAAMAEEQSKLLLWVTGAMVSAEDAKLTEDQWVLNKIVAQFEAENPGVDIEVALFSDAQAMMQMFKAAAGGKDAPDIVNLWAGQQLFEMKDILLDISALIPAEDKEQILGWNIASLDFVEGNPILGYPTSGNEVCGIFYNRQVLAACGLDYDVNPPADVAQMMADMQVIKDAGYLPMAAADGGWGEAFFTTYAKWWVQASGSERVASNSQGITKFADDQGFLNAIQIAADMYSKNFINVDYATIPASIELFLDGQTAFLANGNWVTGDATATLGEANVGFLCPPDISTDVTEKNTCIGGPGQVLSVSKSCTQPELAVKFLSFLSGKDNLSKIITSQAKLPLRTDMTPADLGISEEGIWKQEFDASMSYVFWADNSMNPTVCAEIQKQSALALTCKMTAQELAEILDKVAAENKAK